MTLALTTHDAGGLTEKDFALARQCDALSLALRRARGTVGALFMPGRGSRPIQMPLTP